jgi:MoaA/NifB/PqqE/SkfB family radical SAM enzyme
MNKRYPKQVIIEVTDMCNLQCKFCPRNEQSKYEGQMSIEVFRELVDKINFKTTVIPWMNGEPLLAKNYTDYVRYVSENGFRQYVTTNGMVWDQEFFEYTLSEDSTIYQLIFSLDGVLPRTAKAARPGTNMHKVVSTIHKYIAMREEALIDNPSLSVPDVAVKICRRGQDWWEIEEYVQMWIPVVDFVIVGDALTGDNEVSMRHAPCQYFDDNFMVIRSTGEMVLCAYNEHIVNEHENPVGNVHAYPTLEAAYNNERYQMFRADQNRGVFHGPCVTCPFAYTGKGFTGTVRFRGNDKEYFYHRDYYNQFFSLKKQEKPDSYYLTPHPAK